MGKTLTVGKIRWLFELTSFSTADEMATELKATIDSSVAPVFRDQPYSLELLETIQKDLDFRGVGKSKCSPYVPPLSTEGQRDIFENIWYWAVLSAEAHELICKAYTESLSHRYQGYPFQHAANPFARLEYHKVEFYKKHHVWGIIRLALLDTAIIGFRDAVRYLKNKGYSLPDRQRLESRPTLGIDWLTLRKSFMSCADMWREFVLPELMPESKDYTVARIAIEKCEGKAHKEVCEAVFPGANYANPVKEISTRYKAVKALAKRFDVEMPPWRT